MKITFLTQKDLDDEYSHECHSVLVDDKEMMFQREYIEPEDATFCRDLSSPFKCKKIILKVIEAIKCGEEVEFEEKTEGY